MTEEADRLAQVLGARIIPGWATVELDRADRELVLPKGWPSAVPAADDIPLGARTRIARGADGSEAIVLLEPFTEGRLAASLVRFGESFVVEYLLVGNLDHATEIAVGDGLTLSSLSWGPFGGERLVVGTPAWGPHLILSESVRKPGNGDPAVTIES
jgi:hypothetical protein